MKSISKYHSVALFVIYTVVLNFKHVSFIDGFVISFLAGYVALSFYLDFHKQPDIKAEFEAKLALMEHKHNEAMKTVIFRTEADIKQMSTDVKDMKSKVAAIGSLKSVGMSQTNIKF